MIGKARALSRKRCSRLVALSGVNQIDCEPTSSTIEHSINLAELLDCSGFHAGYPRQVFEMEWIPDRPCARSFLTSSYCKFAGKNTCTRASRFLLGDTCAHFFWLALSSCQFLPLVRLLLNKIIHR